MKQKNIENKLDNLFNPIDEKEKLDFESMIINEHITDVIKALMKQNGIGSRSELALRLGVRPPHVTNLFRGTKRYNLTTLARLQRVFNTSFTFSAKSLSVNVNPIFESKMAKEAKVIKFSPQEVESNETSFAIVNSKLAMIS
ncbi:MAG: helix-turn-helix transcriptional regulator [Parachlamydiaceae bacterium]|nr:helix-turn-helix transcriptional regulator [Parachlamydiaceae bacterium]